MNRSRLIDLLEHVKSVKTQYIVVIALIYTVCWHIQTVWAIIWWN